MTEADFIGQRIDRWANMESPEFWDEADVLDEIVTDAEAAADITRAEAKQFLDRMREVLNDLRHRE